MAALSPTTEKQTLEQRLLQGVVICGEGYLFELERRGYVSVGAFVPEVVLDNPSAVEELHREYMRCGSDVVEAFTYYAHREKMRLVGKEHLLEDLNRKALEIAKKVAAEGNALVAGNICNTNVYDPTNPKSIEETRAMFEEQTRWAAEAGVDFIIAETLDFLGEALLAVEAIKKHNLPSVVTLGLSRMMVRDHPDWIDAFLQLKKAGATVVGLNCTRGPETMLPLLKELCEKIPGPIAALPVPYKTTPEKPTFQSLCCGDHLYTELEPYLCTRYEMADFTKAAVEMGVTYIGVCCGGAPYHVRAMAEALGRRPPASRYSPNLTLHFAYGTDSSLKKIHTDTKHEKF